MPEEWDRFKFDIGNGGQLTTVRHIAHVQSARRIIQDSRIKAGLIYDASKLNKYRISVAWVSANTWVFGSIYGTVEFRFSWADLIAGRNLYWVEEMTGYKPTAFRLLLSKRDITSGVVKRYDPVNDEGPLRLSDGNWYWNYNYTSEFMIEDDLSLDQCSGISFATHHSDYCSPFDNDCDDMRAQPSLQRTGGRLLSFILGSDLHVLDKHLAGSELDIAFEGLERDLAATVQFKGPLQSDASCQYAVRGSLALYGMDQLTQARSLLSRLSSKAHFTKALTAIVCDHFGDPLWQPTQEE